MVEVGGRIVRFEDRAEAGRWLRQLVADRPVPGPHTVVVALTDGGRAVAEALLEDDGRVHVVDKLADLGRLPPMPDSVLVVDDGEHPTEVLAAAVWALHSLGPASLAVVAPFASRYLDGALPETVEVLAAARYTPHLEPAFWYDEDEQAFNQEMERASESPAARRKRELPPRTGQPWDADEEQRLDALVREGLPIAEIATRLGRTRGGVTSRIAQRAVQHGQPPPSP